MSSTQLIPCVFYASHSLDIKVGEAMVMETGEIREEVTPTMEIILSMAEIILTMVMILMRQLWR